MRALATESHEYVAATSDSVWRVAARRKIIAFAWPEDQDLRRAAPWGVIQPDRAKADDSVGMVSGRLAVGMRTMCDRGPPAA